MTDVDERTSIFKVSYDHQYLDPDGLQLGERIARTHEALVGYQSLRDLTRKLRLPFSVISSVRSLTLHGSSPALANCALIPGFSHPMNTGDADHVVGADQAERRDRPPCQHRLGVQVRRPRPQGSAQSVET